MVVIKYDKASNKFVETPSFVAYKLLLDPGDITLDDVLEALFTIKNQSLASAARSDLDNNPIVWYLAHLYASELVNYHMIRGFTSLTSYSLSAATSYPFENDLDVTSVNASYAKKTLYFDYDGNQVTSGDMWYTKLTYNFTHGIDYNVSSSNVYFKTWDESGIHAVSGSYNAQNAVVTLSPYQSNQPSNFRHDVTPIDVEYIIQTRPNQISPIIEEGFEKVRAEISKRYVSR